MCPRWLVDRMQLLTVCQTSPSQWHCHSQLHSLTSLIASIDCANRAHCVAFSSPANPSAITRCQAAAHVVTRSATGHSSSSSSGSSTHPLQRAHRHRLARVRRMRCPACWRRDRPCCRPTSVAAHRIAEEVSESRKYYL